MQENSVAVDIRLDVQYVCAGGGVGMRKGDRPVVCMHSHFTFQVVCRYLMQPVFREYSTSVHCCFSLHGAWMQAAIVVTPSVLSVCSEALAMLLTAVSAGEQEEGGQVDLSQLVLVADTPVKLHTTQSPALTTEVRGSVEGGRVMCG